MLPPAAAAPWPARAAAGSLAPARAERGRRAGPGLPAPSTAQPSGASSTRVWHREAAVQNHLSAALKEAAGAVSVVLVPGLVLQPLGLASFSAKPLWAGRQLPVVQRVGATPGWDPGAA